ncbi:MAG: DUF3492 domain-containing protein [Balneolaceae bacterium]|nr:DUF3492 domain-containing protein [Balneolaceae bacterium]
MKVLLIIEGTYPWYRGGVSEWVYQYLAELTHCSFTILQIATDEFQGLDPQQALYPFTDNISGFIRVKPPEMNGEWDADAKKWYSSLTQKIHAALNDQEIIHVTNTGFAGWLGTQVAHATNLPLVLTEHAIYWKEIEKGAVALECGYKVPLQQHRKQAIVQVFKDMATAVYQQSSKIITVSRSNIPYQRDLGAKHIEYIPNGIPKSWLNPFNGMGEQPTIGWVGRCAEMKNPLLFFDVVAELRKSSLQPNYTMLLSDANEKELEAQVKQKAIRFPEVQLIWNQNSKEYFPDFDFLMITSHNESQPLVMLEALANAALPAGWQVGDLTSEYGIVVKEGAMVTELVSAIEQVWNTPLRYKQRVEERFEFVKDHHLWKDIFSRYQEVFEQLIFQQTAIH